MAFSKKDYVYTEALGVCRVEEVTNLMQKDGTVTEYYGLRSVRNKNKTAYYPVEHHEAEIRELMSLEDANAIIAKRAEEKSELELDADKEDENEKKQEFDQVLYEAKFVVELSKKKKNKK